jgi:hypothetical protein
MLSSLSVRLAGSPAGGCFAKAAYLAQASKKKEDSSQRRLQDQAAWFLPVRMKKYLKEIHSYPF